MATSVLATLLPDAVKLIEADEAAWKGELFKEEADHIRRAVSKRADEYRAARTCARIALKHFDIPPQPILSGKNRQPLWPAGITGSITHTEDYCAVAVARTADIQSIGIDVEGNSPLDTDLRSMICTETERAWIDQWGTQSYPQGIWEKIIFSCKESIYKAFNPIYGVFLDFQEATLSLDARQGCFIAAIHQREHSIQLQWQGRFALDQRYVYSAVVIQS